MKYITGVDFESLKTSAISSSFSASCLWFQIGAALAACQPAAELPHRGGHELLDGWNHKQKSTLSMYVALDMVFYHIKNETDIEVGTGE